MRFNKQAGDTHRHTGARQFGNLRTASAGRGAKRVAALQSVGNVEDNR
jgi:hypothetical protein